MEQKAPIYAAKADNIGTPAAESNRVVAMSSPEISKEEQILALMRKTLTGIAKDTYTEPGLKHPLSEQTIVSIRDCLQLITLREAELQKQAGRASTLRPRYVDEPKKSSVVVQLNTSAGTKKPGPDKS